MQVQVVGGNNVFMSTSYPRREKPIRNKTTRFSEQDVDLSETPLFFPEGYEKLFIAFYFISLPYIAGLIFQFFYIADAKVELFLSLNEQSSFILTWAIGYEIIAAIILLFILKMAIGFANENRKPGVREFRRP
jgi:hypothetical protein